MTKLNEMWAALAVYQPQADAAGHGETWARMCSEKTYAAAAYAADAAYAAELAQKAIDRIKVITPPPQRTWVGLTDDEWSSLYEAHHDKYGLPNQGSPDGLDYERAIEAKLKEKNT